MKKSDALFVLGPFIIWRVFLTLAVILGILYLPLQSNFLGGGMQEYLKNPHFWSWMNFDGEHYLAIAREGYKPLTYFFFPAFPLIAGFAGKLFGDSIVNLAVSGTILNHIFFALGLIGFWKLARLDYGRDVAVSSVFLLLLFPTSFYFAAFYTESLFLMLSVWSFYFARKEDWLFASLLAMAASGTRIIGILLFPALIIEALYRKKFKLNHLYLLIAPLGLVAYMIFLKIQTGDPLNFLNTIEIFGGQRSSSIILLPQVFYRYVFKIIPNIDYSYFPSVFVTYLEFLSGLLFLALSIFSFFKLRLSYSIFLFLGFLIPTFSGSFSSLPRYVLVLFPAYFILSVLMKKIPAPLKFLIYSLLLESLIYSTALFARGYWVS